MSNSLRDQLLKAGLVSETQVKHAEKASKKDGRKTRHEQKRTGQRPKSSVAERIEQVQAEKVARDRRLNREQEIVRAKKAARAQVSDLVKRHRLNDPRAEVRYYFQRGNHIKQLDVTQEQREGLVTGRLAIITFQGGQHLITMEVADKIAKIDPEAKIHRHEASPSEPEADDPYRDYQVPDDLMW
jgi:uncharacterized protein YaiL (DUF2058 family)